MLENMSKTDKRNFLYTLIALGIILGAFSLMIVLFSMKANEASFEVIDEGQYVHMDYDPRPFLDSQWEFTFNSYVRTVGSGSYKEEIYPFITYFKFYFQDFDNNRPVAQKYYSESEWIHPGDQISFKHTFHAYLFEKGKYLAKLRVELNIANETAFDTIDFNIEIRGSATSAEIAYIVTPFVALSVCLLVTYLLQRFLNERMTESVTLYNAWKLLFVYWTKKRKLKKEARKEKRAAAKQEEDIINDIDIFLNGKMDESEFSKTYFPALQPFEKEVEKKDGSQRQST